MATGYPTIIRAYEPAHVERAIDIYRSAIHTTAASFYTRAQLEAWAPQKADATKWNERLLEFKTFFAERNGALTAFISWEMNGHIAMLFTHPDFARQGFAKSLYRCAEFAFLEAGLTRAFAEASLAARPFFARCGFEVEHEEEVECRNEQLRRFVMRKPLVPFKSDCTLFDHTGDLTP
jgi:GNAT superfamily N-acetyltransferase